MIIPPVLSVSQVEKFDPEQLGGCQLRWWFEDVRGLRPDSTAVHEDGHQGHALLAHYLTTGVRPGRVRLGKAVNAVIDSGVLPTPGPDLRVEDRFSLQDHRDASGAWIPLDVRRTLWHAGHPWEGFIDLRFRRGPARAVWVWDHNFSSDIPARALPADRLLRTVQMPVYALNSLRVWPDATVFNLVHLYVSQRGVESFVRQQSVTVEQVQERCAELIPLVRQMDAVRAVTAQDDVPFNRAACHARTGCPHQFRCNAFKRRGTMKDLTDEEKAMFGVLSDEPTKPVMAEVTKVVTMELRTTPARVAGPLPDAPAGRVTAPAELNLDDIFETPMASTPKPQPAPTCEARGEVLTPENSSRLKTGDVKHIGCPADARASEAAKPAGGPPCPNCPHPPHAGKPCEGKRGRGACRCGAAVEQLKPGRVLADGTKVEPSGKPQQSAAELQALAYEAARAADVDGDGAAVAEAQGLQRAADEAREREEAAPVMAGGRTAERFYRESLPDAPEEAQPEGKERITSAHFMSQGGPLAVTVNVTVELGPSTLAFLAGLVKR